MGWSQHSMATPNLPGRIMSADIHFIIGLQAVWEGFLIGFAIMAGFLFMELLLLGLKRMFGK